uniref:Antimicrobial peptide NK-lysin n=1 Tax=Fundulus heteroclitus TaxID=8078 RepID=A0A3Q2NPA0_FUNHE
GHFSVKLTFIILLNLSTVWMIQGRNLQVNIDDEELAEPNAKQQGIPGICWGCKWALNRVKKVLGKNSTVQLKSVCDKIGLLKSKCKKFVDKNLGVLVEELTTTDDVRTICVNLTEGIMGSVVSQCSTSFS